MLPGRLAVARKSLKRDEQIHIVEDVNPVACFSSSDPRISVELYWDTTTSKG